MYKIPAITAPITGAKINTQTCCNACPPRKRAGAKLCAGFTDVPVKGIPKMCTNARVKPITIPATAPFSAFLVTPSTVNTNTKVKIISTNIAPTTLNQHLMRSRIRFDQGLLLYILRDLGQS